MKTIPARLPLRNSIHLFLAAFGIILGFIVLSSCSSRETQVPTPSLKPKEVEIIRDVAYHSDGLEEHQLDVYLPNLIEGPFPTLLMIHGGSGQKIDLSYWGQTMAKEGYAAISIDHRQWPEHSYPNHIEDAFCALAWIYSSADLYELDTSNIFVLGHSAGGTLAAMIGVIKDPAPYLEGCPQSLPEKDWVKGVIPFTGIFDYNTASQYSPSLEEYAVGLLGGSRQDIPDIWEKASASSWIDGNEPPFLLIHGEDDQNINPQQSLDFASLIKTAGGEVELLLIPNADHNQIKSSPQSIEAVENFISGIID